MRDEDKAVLRETFGTYFNPTPGGVLLDVGAGTGDFAVAFADWFEIDVVAVEPSSASRQQIPDHPRVRAVDGRAEDLPVPDASADGAWLSRVTHHGLDLVRAAGELRRALRPGSPVLIREVFAGRDSGLTLRRFFPGVSRRFDTYPSLEQTCAAFAGSGFEQVALVSLPLTIAASLADYARGIRKEADGLLRQLTDEEFERGCALLRDAARAETPGAGRSGPVVDHLDLLVLA